MKVIQSASFTYDQPVTLNLIYRFYKKVQSCQSNVLLCKNGLYSQGKTLTALVSFFLLLKKGDPYLLIAEGEDANKDLQALSLLFGGTYEEEGVFA
ncbi:HPr family phosphocarrier protein [Fictibacillus gelatini]|uniref:HPr family phosphocarrier protein n=1 Tax=Fictibacillus gelatini TaxID=225985 RepID=UPI00041F88F6|nr:HPr family phosphocarrier protein [Fictibacillus gelatini]